jgi:hypothetical protein
MTTVSAALRAGADRIRVRATLPTSPASYHVSLKRQSIRNPRAKKPPSRAAEVGRLYVAVTLLGHNVYMSEEYPLTLRQVRTDVSRLLLTRGQRLKLRLFLGFAKVLRRFRLI